MGNTTAGRRNSVLSKESSLSEALTPAEEAAAAQGPMPPPLTDHQIELLTKTWKLLEEDIAKVGVITFIRLVIISLLLFCFFLFYLKAAFKA
ncbi:hypothetical protein O3M35_007235 [Rhynocoris fuscipes]|uniref:Uncharacterized protein n=1 Tax=Rhynocoris fuscipes TaxID=488301 RepID=A0AAW1DA89_9HEMI